MPQSPEAIKHSPLSSETWRNNKTQVMWFDPRKIQPLGDHILIELDEGTEPTFLHVPDSAKNQEIGTRIGTVLKVGPGKWREKRNWEETWMLNPYVLDPMRLKPGDRVVIGHYSDWESWNCSADGHQQRDKNIVLCQQNDVRLILE